VVEPRAARRRRDPWFCRAWPRAAEWPGARGVERVLPRAWHQHRQLGRRANRSRRSLRRRGSPGPAPRSRRSVAVTPRAARLSHSIAPRATAKAGSAGPASIPPWLGWRPRSYTSNSTTFAPANGSRGSCTRSRRRSRRRASADVAAYFASRPNGLMPIRRERLQSGHNLREKNPAIRLVFAGDPARGIPP
jgi:hypothetical protein